MQQRIQQLINIYYPEQQQFLIAFSGGLDSTVLLTLFAKLCKTQPNLKVRALHIHHGLSPNADKWSEHCQHFCQQLNIPLLIQKVTVIPKQGIESGARAARYQAIATIRQTNETVVTAHHQNDQTETFFLALKRGSGIQGLGAMQIKSELFGMPLFRPLLEFSRQQLENYAKQQQLDWIEDESNQDNRYERNFLRNEILPKLRQQWTHIDQAVQRSAQHCFEQQQLLNELLKEEFSQIFDKTDRTFGLQKFADYSALKQKALLRLWFAEHQLAMPSRVQLQQLINDVILAKNDSNPQFKLTDKILRRYQQKLYLTPIFADLSHLSIPLEINQPVNLPDQLGRLTIIKNQQNLTALWQTEDQQYTSLLPFTTEQIWLRFHYSGKVKISENTPRREIKKLWQQHNIAPWQRSRIPLIFYADQFKSAVGFFENV